MPKVAAAPRKKASSDAATSTPGSIGWRFLLFVALGALLLHLPYLFPGGPWARKPELLPLVQDEGTVLYDALRITRGEVMYRDFFEFQGPVFYYLNAALFALVGPSLLAARLLHLVTTAIGAALLAGVVGRFAGRTAGVGAALVHACVLLPMWPISYAHWLAEVFVLGAIALLVREGDEPNAPREIAAGGLLGLAVLTIQSLGVPALVAVLGTRLAPGIAARDRRECWVRPMRVLGGALLAGMPVLVWFGANGALGDLVYAMFVWPFEHYAHGNEVAYGWWTDNAVRLHEQVLATPWSTLAIWALRGAYYLPMAALAGAAVVLPWALYRLARRQQGFAFATAGGVALAGVAALFLAPVRPDLTHVAYAGGFGLIALAVVLSPVALRLRPARFVVGAMFLAAGAIALATYAHKTAHTWQASRALGSWRAELDKLPDARRLAEAAGRDGTIVVGERAGFYHLLGPASAIPHTYLPGRFVAYLSDAQWNRTADRIVTRKPRALRLVGVQWKELTRRRPELVTLYRAEHGLYVLAAATEPRSGS